MYNFPFNRLLFESVYYYSFQEKKGETISVKFSSQETFVNLGYDVLNKKDIFLFLLVGGGVSFLNLKIRNTSHPPTSFNQALSNLNQMSEIYSNRETPPFFLNLGANLEVPFYNFRQLNFLIGISAGYKLQLSKIIWQADNIKLTEPPKLNLSGFYIGLYSAFK